MTSVDISRVDHLLNDPSALNPVGESLKCGFQGLKCCHCDLILFGEVVSFDCKCGEDLLCHKTCSNKPLSCGYEVKAKEANESVKKLLKRTLDFISVQCPAECGEVVPFKELSTHMKTTCSRVFRSCRSSKFGCKTYDSLPNVKEHEEDECEYRLFHDLAEKYEQRICSLETRLEIFEKTLSIPPEKPEDNNVQSNTIFLERGETARDIFFEQPFKAEPKIIVLMKDYDDGNVHFSTEVIEDTEGFKGFKLKMLSCSGESDHAPIKITYIAHI